MHSKESISTERDDAYWMSYALDLARLAQMKGEVPVGAVLVRDGEILGEGWNSVITLHDASAHAEVMALRDAGKKAQNYRLVDTTLYVTLEPCIMCTGSLLHARVSRLVYGAFDYKTGAVDSVFQLLSSPQHYHHIEVCGGVLESECRELIQHFFRQRREQKKQYKQAQQ